MAITDERTMSDLPENFDVLRSGHQAKPADVLKTDHEAALGDGARPPTNVLGGMPSRQSRSVLASLAIDSLANGTPRIELSRLPQL